jgi:lipopolysaccharide transport system ATP-binding protein
MLDDDIVVSAENLGKFYRIWRDPSARLKAPLVNSFSKLLSFGKGEKTGESRDDGSTRVYNKTRYYQDFRALRGVDLSLKKGQSVGIIGRNGSGKSTLLQMIAGTLTPSEGKVETRGRLAALLELGAGFNDEFTGRENVYMNASILGLTKSEIDDRFDDIAAFANIGDFIEQPIKTYSSGMRVRLAFAVQAEVDPDILIVDEALAVGDIRFTQKCIRRMQDLIANDTTLLFVSHDLSSIVNFCKEVIWIHDGEIRDIGDPRRVCVEYSNFMHYGELTKGKTASITKPQTEESSSTEAAAVRQIHPSLPENLNWICLRDMPHDGLGGAKFLEAALYCPAHPSNNSLFAGGENIEVYLFVEAHRTMDSPIFCCDIYDSKGSLMYGVNSCFIDSECHPMEAGKSYVYKFATRLQKLRNGDYFILFGLSNGTYEAHQHEYGVAEALTFEVKSRQLSQRHHMISFDEGFIEQIELGE